MEKTPKSKSTFYYFRTTKIKTEKTFINCIMNLFLGYPTVDFVYTSSLPMPNSKARTIIIVLGG